MTHRAVIFDLDGTLADTLGQIATASNHALEQLGHAPLPEARYRTLAGQGVRFLAEHALGPDHQHQLEAMLGLIRDYYAEHGYHAARAFAGVPELLSELRQRSMRLAVLSNRPHDAAMGIVQTCFDVGVFDAVQGEAPGVPLKPDPAGALQIAAQLGVEARSCVYVGDTQADMLTGKGAGMLTVGVTWGFRELAELRDNGADAIIDRPGELLEQILKQPA